MGRLLVKQSSRAWLIATVVAPLVALPLPAAAITFDGSFSVDFQNVDPGLVVSANPSSGSIPIAPFDLNTPGDSTGWFPLFDISTDECCVNADDTVAKPISVEFDFSAPPPGFNGTVPGQTVGNSILGIVEWGSVSWGDPISLSFGNGGVLLAFLSDEIFDKGLFGLGNHGATVDAKFTLLEAPSPVPPPPALILFISGIGTLSVAVRRPGRRTRPVSPSSC